MIRPYVLHARLAHDIDRTRHLCEGDLFRPLHERDFVTTPLEYLGKACAERVPISLNLIKK